MKFKKFMALTAACIFALLMVFAAGCGTVTEAIKNPGEDIVKPDEPDNPDVPVDPSAETTVTLTVEQGEAWVKYTSHGPGVTAQFRAVNGNNEVKTAPFINGTATIKGLDGEYQVTVSGLDKNVTPGPLARYYAYDTNAYEVNNLQRDCQIKLYEVNMINNKKGQGEQAFGSNGITSNMVLRKAGVYRVNIYEQGQEVFLRYQSDESGEFSIVSWVNAAENEIDPVATFYGGSAQYCPTTGTTYDTGGTAGDFTTNFKFTVRLAEDQITGAYNFSVSATDRYGTKPDPSNPDDPIFYFDFYIGRDADYEIDTVIAEVVLPVGYPEKQLESFKGKRQEVKVVQDGKVISTVQINNADGTPALDINGKPVTPPSASGSGYYQIFDHIYSASGASRILDQSLVGLNEEDGFYHLLDEDGQPNGPLVYAHISTASDIYGTALINIEDSGNNALTLFTPDGKNRYDYQLMLQGHDLAQQKFQAGASERGGSSKKSSRADNDKDLDPYPQYKDCKGYYDCVDEYGLYPVNEQLKEFLQYFANSQQLFKDGEGWVEINSKEITGYQYDAYEDSMWLFDCVYFLGDLY